MVIDYNYNVFYRATGQSFSNKASAPPPSYDDMLFTTMSNVSQRFARIPTARRKVLNNLYYAGDEAVIRSGPFVIPRLNNFHLNPTNEDKNRAAGVEMPFNSQLSPLEGTTMNGMKNLISHLAPSNYPQVQSINQHASKDFNTWPSKMKIMSQQKMNTISFYIKDLKSVRPPVEADFFDGHNKKYNSVDNMYKTLRTQILDYIKVKDGIVKREHDVISDNGVGNVGKLDVPFQRILDGAEGVLNSMVLRELHTNITKLGIDQVASLVEDSEPQRKMELERSVKGYNDTYNDEPEEESPETQELAESLNHLPLGGGGFYSQSVPPSVASVETKTHRLIDPNRRYTKDREDRFWAPRKKANTLLSDSFVDKVTEVNYDPEDIADQELSEGEVTENADETPQSPETLRPAPYLQDFRVLEKNGQEDEALNRKIDQRICNALDMLKNALVCGLNISEGVSYPVTSTSSTENLELMAASSEQPVEEELTCVDTTCPPSSVTMKMGGKEHMTSTTKHGNFPMKTSTSSSIRKSLKPVLDNNTSKSTRDTKKLSPTKSVSKKTTPQKDSNRRNAIKFHLSQKLKKSRAMDQKDGLSDYEKVFGTKRARLSQPLKGIRSKYTKVTKISKTGNSNSR